MPAPPNNTAPSGVYRLVTKGSPLPNGPCKALWVATAGTANLVDYEGVTVSNFPLLQGLNPIGCTAVNSGGNSDGIWALY